MTDDLTIRCACGSLQGRIIDVSPQVANRIVCHCDSCQQYAHRLGRAEEILDAHRGTEVFQISPATLQITRGDEYLSCGQISRKGALRWYAGCCNTPLAHTLPSPAIPFMAVNHSCVQWQNVDREQAVGPLRARVNSKKPLPKTEFTALLGMLKHYLPLFIRWWWRGDQRKSPFFEPTTQNPVVEPKMLEQRETQSLRKGELSTAKGCG